MKLELDGNTFRVHLTKLNTIKKIEAYDIETGEWVDVSDRLWAIKMAERLVAKELSNK